MCSSRVMPKCDFFLKKRMKEIIAYVLEFMLTFNKMQNTTSLMCTKVEIRGQIMLCPQISN